MGPVDEHQARARFAASRVARFASVGGDAVPHLVPVTFAMPDDESVVFAVDHKPKTTPRLKRLTNVRQNPRVALLADAYSGDWSSLWWVRADAHATVLDLDDERTRLAVDALVDRYPQYRWNRPVGPVVWCDVSRWVGWSAT